METMRAAVYGGLGEIEVTTRPVPRIGPGDLLLRVETAGVCGSDVAAFRVGPQTCPPPALELPVVLGHEFAGTVVAVGRDVEGFAEGDQVVAGAGLSCGRCDPCRAGRTNLCLSYRTLGIHLDGGLAEYVRVPDPARVCVKVDPAIAPDLAAMAQPMAIAEHAVSRAAPLSGETTLSVGVGGIGAFILHAAVARGAHVIALDSDPQRLDLALSLGAAEVVVSDPAGEALRERLRTSRPSCIFDVTGVAGVVTAIVEGAPRGARIAVVGVQKEPVALPVRRITLDELTLVGTVAHVMMRDLPRAVDLLRERDDWSDVAPTVRPLDEIVSHALNPVPGVTAPVKSLFAPSATSARATRWV